MQYQKNISVWIILVFVFCCGGVLAQDNQSQQKSRKTQKTTKYPTQFDKIIDSDDKKPSPEQPANTTPSGSGAKSEMQFSEALIKALEGLSAEVKNLVNEVHTNNAQQQIQTDILRMSRLDLRIDRYESELKTVRDRLALVDTDYQNLQLLLTPESIEAQVSRMPYASKSDAIRQVKETHEARLRIVTKEREVLQQREAELFEALKGFREASNETEKRLQVLEDALKKNNQPESSKEGSADKPKPDMPEEK